MRVALAICLALTVLQCASGDCSDNSYGSGLTGSWDDALKWQLKHEPIASEVAVIQTGAVVNVDSENNVAKRGVIQAGAKLRLQQGTGPMLRLLGGDCPSEICFPELTGEACTAIDCLGQRFDPNVATGDWVVGDNWSLDVVPENDHVVYVDSSVVRVEEAAQPAQSERLFIGASGQVRIAAGSTAQLRLSGGSCADGEPADCGILAITGSSGCAAAGHGAACAVECDAPTVAGGGYGASGDEAICQFGTWTWVPQCFAPAYCQVADLPAVAGGDWQTTDPVGVGLSAEVLCSDAERYSELATPSQTGTIQCVLDGSQLPVWDVANAPRCMLRSVVSASVADKHIAQWTAPVLLAAYSDAQFESELELLIATVSGSIVADVVVLSSSTNADGSTSVSFALGTASDAEQDQALDIIRFTDYEALNRATYPLLSQGRQHAVSANAALCTDSCNGHGNCIGETTPTCYCDDGWSGPACSVSACPIAFSQTPLAIDYEPIFDIPSSGYEDIPDVLTIYFFNPRKSDSFFKSAKLAVNESASANLGVPANDVTDESSGVTYSRFCFDRIRVRAPWAALVAKAGALQLENVGDKARFTGKLEIENTQTITLTTAGDREIVTEQRRLSELLYSLQFQLTATVSLADISVFQNADMQFRITTQQVDITFDGGNNGATAVTAYAEFALSIQWPFRVNTDPVFTSPSYGALGTVSAAQYLDCPDYGDSTSPDYNAVCGDVVDSAAPNECACFQRYRISWDFQSGQETYCELDGVYRFDWLASCHPSFTSATGANTDCPLTPDFLGQPGNAPFISFDIDTENFCPQVVDTLGVSAQMNIYKSLDHPGIDPNNFALGQTAYFKVDSTSTLLTIAGTTLTLVKVLFPSDGSEFVVFDNAAGGDQSVVPGFAVQDSGDSANGSADPEVDGGNVADNQSWFQFVLAEPSAGGVFNPPVDGAKQFNVYVELDVAYASALLLDEDEGKDASPRRVKRMAGLLQSPITRDGSTVARGSFRSQETVVDPPATSGSETTGDEIAPAPRVVAATTPLALAAALAALRL